MVSVNRAEYCISKAGLAMATAALRRPAGRGKHPHLRGAAGGDAERHDGRGGGKIRPAHRRRPLSPAALGRTGRRGPRRVLPRPGRVSLQQRACLHGGRRAHHPASLSRASGGTDLPHPRLARWSGALLRCPDAAPLVPPFARGPAVASTAPRGLTRFPQGQPRPHPPVDGRRHVPSRYLRRQTGSPPGHPRRPAIDGERPGRCLCQCRAEENRRHDGPLRPRPEPNQSRGQPRPGFASRPHRTAALARARVPLFRIRALGHVPLFQPHAALRGHPRRPPLRQTGFPPGGPGALRNPR